MPPKKKPLEDARKRLQEKLNNVEEQSEYICQFINDLVNKVICITKISYHKLFLKSLHVDNKMDSSLQLFRGLRCSCLCAVCSLWATCVGRADHGAGLSEQ